MLCWLCASTEPKAIRSFAGGAVRAPRFEGYSVPKKDANAKALERGVLLFSVKILNSLRFTIYFENFLHFCNFSPARQSFYVNVQFRTITLLFCRHLKRAESLSSFNRLSYGFPMKIKSITNRRDFRKLFFLLLLIHRRFHSDRAEEKNFYLSLSQIRFGAA